MHFFNSAVEVTDRQALWIGCVDVYAGEFDINGITCQIMTGALATVLEKPKADDEGREASEASLSPNGKCLFLVYSLSYIE